MSRAIKYGDKSLRFLYYQYKDSVYYFPSVIAITVLTLILLFIYVVVPQFQRWFSIRNEVIAVRSKIDTLNQNINFMNNLDKNLVDSQLQIAASALPPEKDFVAIINVINEAAIDSGVSVQDFSFAAGDGEQIVAADESNSKADLSPIQIAIEVNGGINNTRRFLAIISEKLPLVEILDIDGDSRSTNINMQFYYKDFPDFVFQDEVPIEPVSDKKAELIRKLSGWRATNGLINTSVPIGTSSAVPLF